MPDLFTAMLGWTFLAVVAAISLLTCAAIVLTQHWHGHLSHDHDLAGIQKMHDTPVPRVGGVGIVLAMVLGLFLLPAHLAEHRATLALLVACGAPVILAGFIEDFTKAVSVRTRLLAAFAAAALAMWLAGSQLTRLNTPGLDALMTFAPLAMLFTVFAAGGVTHSVNIIDGLNGLASGSVVIMLAGLGTMAHVAGDGLVLSMCLMGMAACLGFMALNFPFGKIFMGDGGAYFMGYWLAQCAILLLARNPSVSTWAVLLACLYPVWETAYSMYRRARVQAASTGLADDQHLHHLLMRRLAGVVGEHSAPAWVKHGVTTLVIWLMVALVQCAAVWASNEALLLVPAMVLCGGVYVMVYSSISGTAPEDDLGDNTADVARA